MSKRRNTGHPRMSERRVRALRQEAAENTFLAELAPMLVVCGNVCRLRLLYVLREEDTLCVSDLADILSVTQPAVTRHLKILRDCGLVNTYRNAQSVLVRLNRNGFGRLVDAAFSNLAKD